MSGQSDFFFAPQGLVVLVQNNIFYSKIKRVTQMAPKNNCQAVFCFIFNKWVIH